VDKAELADKFRGALLGMAVGDALGMPAQGMSPYEVAKSFQLIDAFYPLRKKGFSAGQYTSSSQLSLVVARSIAKSKGVDKKSIEEGYSSITSPKTLPDDVRTPMKKLRSGWGEASAATSASCSFLPRMIPVGLWASVARPSDGELLKICKIVALPSHGDRSAIIAGYIIAKLVMECAYDSSALGSPYNMCESEKSLLSRVGLIVRQAESRLSEEELGNDRMWMRLQELSTKLQSNVTAQEVSGLFGQGDDARTVATVAIFCFLSAPDDFSSVMTAASLGGESAVRAAVVGGLCGAFAGDDFMPADMVEHVENSAKIGALGNMLAESLAAKE
jgi:ADP-ribosyl-[dinitrogen reductase] hydrolase